MWHVCHINRLDMTLSLQKAVKPMEVSQQLCSEDSSKLTHIFTHLQALPLGHAAFMVGALYVGIVGLPPQQGGRVCAGSQKHLTGDCQSRPCVQQDTAH